MTFSGKSFLLTICGILFSLSLAAQHFNIGLGNPYSTSFKLAFSEARFDYTVKTFHLGAKFGVEDVFRKGFRNFYTGLGGRNVVSPFLWFLLFFSYERRRKGIFIRRY